MGENRRGLQVLQQLSQTVCQTSEATGIVVQGPLLNKVHHYHPSSFVQIAYSRGNTGFRRDAHRLVLVGISQRARLPFRAEQVAAAAELNSQR